MNPTYVELYSYTASLPVYNTHAHQDLNLDIDGFTLDKLFHNSYINWCGVAWDDTFESRKALLDKLRHNSFYVWTEHALRDLYQYDYPLTADQWDKLSAQISQAHARPDYWVSLLVKTCRYEGIIQDSYWNPGSDWQQPSLFTPTFRVNSFFFGYHPAEADHDGNNALQLYRQGEPIQALDDYIAFMHRKVVEMHTQGCVAIKIPIAYDRSLNFVETSFSQANSAYQRLIMDPSQTQDVKDFQNYLFYEVCRIAAELDIPVQIHTGMGKMDQSNALCLRESIHKNPKTKFVLLHCSFPWTHDTMALVRTYPNVHPDLAWLPRLNSDGACRMIQDLVEAGVADKLCWGCDTWTPEESLGSLFAFRHVLAKAISEKIEEGWLTIDEAKKIIRQVTHENARNLYKKT